MRLHTFLAVRLFLRCHPDRSSPTFSLAPQLGASGCAVERHSPTTPCRLYLDTRDHGNQLTHSRFDESISVRRFTAVSSPLSTYSLFLSFPYIFPLVEIPFSI